MPSNKPEFKLLIVDDMPQSIKMLDHCLRGAYDIIYATSGKEAVEMALSEKIDLIILDVMMPEMDGYEVCQILKTNTITKDIPIIFLTAKTHEQDILLGFKAGAVDYITKPFSSGELLARVQIHLELKKARGIIEKQAEELAWTNQQLKKKNQRLQQVIDEVETLKGLLPICSNCKKIRLPSQPDQPDTWVSLEAYLHAHTAVEVTHSICPVCMTALYPDLIEPEDNL